MISNQRFLYTGLLTLLSVWFYSSAFAQNSRLLPSIEDEIRFAGFLEQPFTGLIRLIPRELCGIPGYPMYDRSTFSFAFSSFVARGADLSLEGGKSELELANQGDFEHYMNPPERYYLYAGGEGLIVELGKVSIEEITLEDMGVKFLSDHTLPLITTSEMKRKLWNGSAIKQNGFKYKIRSSISLNHTYVMRSVHYEQSDIMVAFQVVRMDRDGSVVILWKTLNKFPTPPSRKTFISAQAEGVR